MVNSMIGPLLQASVIIPTHNRSSTLLNTLRALNAQSISVAAFEVIVVDDGCTDDTVEAVLAFQAPFSLRLLRQPQSGPSAARNLGANRARGAILIFLDDDIEVQPQFVAAHLEAHKTQGNLVVIGYCPPLLSNQYGYFRAELAGWWHAMFARMNQPGYRFAYSDILSGNFSLEAGLFAQVGKFDPAFACHEDYELGMRLLLAGTKFIFAMSAGGFHHEHTDVWRALTRKQAEGKADVMLGWLYPALRSSMLMARLDLYGRLPSRIFKILAFKAPPLEVHMRRWMLLWLDWLERARWLRLWQRLLYGMMAYAYWQGVAGELKSLNAQKAFLADTMDAWQGKTIDLYLDRGLPEAKRVLDSQRPAGIRLWYFEQEAGLVLPQPGKENLCGNHLEAICFEDQIAPLLRALVDSRGLDNPGISSLLISANE